MSALDLNATNCPFEIYLHKVKQWQCEKDHKPEIYDEPEVFSRLKRRRHNPPQGATPQEKEQWRRWVQEDRDAWETAPDDIQADMIDEEGRRDRDEWARQAPPPGGVVS